jgi:hypothetical protein
VALGFHKEQEMNFLNMKTWNPASSSLWKEIVSRWGEDVYADSVLRQEKINELKLEYDAKQYTRDRSTAYPAIGDQLDALYHAGVFPEDMAAQIQAVKERYPKT